MKSSKEKYVEFGNIVGVWTKFENIPDGAHFEDGHGRKFIKLVSKTACGIPQTFHRHFGERVEVHPFNAVDYQGFIGTCPAWCPFKIIKNK